MRRYIVIGSLILCCLMVVGALAQTSVSRLEGVVTDQSGAVIPGAKVTALNVRTDVSAETTTTAAGIYVFPSLQPGAYTVSAEAPGFRKQVRTNLTLLVSVIVSENFKMEVGQVTESVVVEANTERVNIAESQLGRSITLRDIDTLPQLGRAPIILSVFQPGVQVDPSDTTFSHVNGNRQGSNNSTLDGIDVNDAVVPRLGLTMTANNVDSVSEFRVVTTGGKAEYGRSAGAQVELVTRSGTNLFHGNAFDYLRNTDLNANNFFNNSSGVQRPKFIQNIFGGSFGGPLRHDRLFVFGNFQGTRTIQDIVRNRTVLTPEAKRGIFRWKAPGTSSVQSFDIAANDPRKKGVDTEMAKIFKLVPDPNNYDVGDGLNTGGFRFNNPNGGGNDQFTTRGDYSLTRNHRIFYRHSWMRTHSNDGLNNADSTYPGQPMGTQGGHRWGYAIGSDWTITPTLVNSARFGYQSASVSFNRPGRLPGPMVITNLLNPDPLNTAFAQGRNSPVREITDNANFVRGKHTFKGGLSARLTLQNGWNDAGIYPNVNLTRNFGNTPPGTIGPSGSAISSADRQQLEYLYNDVLGRMSDVQQTFYSNLQQWQKAGTSRVRNTIFHEYGYFFQDDWRVKKNLTLNLGVRWEFSGVPCERDGFQGTLTQAAQISPVNQIANLAVQRSSQWYNNDYNNFAPRVGFAWDLKGDGKMALRGGYGIYYDRIIGATSNAVDAATPGFSQNVPVYPNSASGSDVRVTDGIPLPGQPAAPVLVLAATRSTNIALFSPNLRTGYTQQYNLTLEREIYRNTIVSASYVGNRGVKLFMNLNYNQPRIYEDFLSAFKQIQAFRSSGAAVPASNVFVRLWGSAAAAVTGIGASVFDQGAVGTAATTVDRSNYTRYAAAGVSDFYLRNYPQYIDVRVGANSGRSYYDSLQLSLRRQAGALKFNANYTFSKSLDNITIEGNGYTAPMDSYNLNLNKARGDFDRPHNLNYSVSYTLPIGKGHRFGGNMPRWADSIAGGWDVGLLSIWQIGAVYGITSGRALTAGGVNSWANYSGDRNIGGVARKGNGVFFLTDDQKASFTFPGAGEVGNSGRNAFRGPRFFNMDMSLVKRFKITERHVVNFRVETYNMLNNVNFGTPGSSLVTPTSLGKIGGTIGNPRIFQMALRYEF